MTHTTYWSDGALPVRPGLRLEQRDLGLIVVGFILGVISIIAFFYYRGGPPALGPISGLFDSAGQSSGDRRQTPTPVPGAPAQGAQPGGSQTMRVKLNGLSVHKCPGYECETVATLPLGAQVSLLGQCNTSAGEEWCRIRSGNGEGWVSRYYLE